MCRLVQYHTGHWGRFQALTIQYGWRCGLIERGFGLLVWRMLMGAALSDWVRTFDWSVYAHIAALCDQGSATSQAEAACYIAAVQCHSSVAADSQSA